MITFLMVEVQSVTSTVPRSNFSEADLDFVADTILESGGILKPLVLKKTGFEKYEVVDGDFEYYAAVRATEKDPRTSEMVNAFVISPKSEEIVAKQVKALMRGVESPDKQVKIPTDTTSLESRLANIELRFEKRFNDLRAEQAQERQRLEVKLKEIESRTTQQSDPLKALNTLTKDGLETELKRSRISNAEKIAKAIEEARKKKQKQEFENYSDVVKSVKGLGEKTMLTIIDDWSRR